MARLRISNRPVVTLTAEICHSPTRQLINHTNNHIQDSGLSAQVPKNKRCERIIRCKLSAGPCAQDCSSMPDWVKVLVESQPALHLSHQRLLQQHQVRREQFHENFR